MNDWKNVNINGVIKLEKCIAEFNVWEQNYSPYAKFKIKIFEGSDNKFSGYSNLLVKDCIGDFYCAIGHGNSVKEALSDTLNCFFDMVSIKDAKEWEENDFMCADSFDF